MSERGEVLWTPPDDVWSSTAAGRFASAHGHDTYAALHHWSVTDLDGFWGAVADDLDVMWHRRPDAVLARGPDGIPGTRWFPGGELSYAEHALRHAEVDPDGVAVTARSQTRAGTTLTWTELVDAVAACAAGLRRLGVGRGDRVVAFAPNVPETLVAMLATASLGAVWSSCAPEFGVRAVVDRFAQLDPTVLVAVDGYRYGERAIDRREHVAAIRDQLPTLRHVVAIPYLDDGLPDATLWGDLLAGPTEPLSFTPVPFDHPLYVLFSSGTTGLPKAIVHSHGGITLEHLKVLTLHQDLTPADRFCWFTTTGWMMWNYLVSGLLTGASIVLFDGDPGHPDLGTLWRTAEETGTTVFGTSAPFLLACRKAGIEPPRGSLRWVGSTGAPLPAAGFRWVDEALGVPVSSISGGTDVCTAFVGSSPLVPVRAGEIPCRLLGCAVEAFDPDGRPLPPGVTGELVVTEPMPSMPVGFWGDEDGARYRDAYFSVFPGVWRHGDWVTFTDDGACTISGRSDATLNRGGVRLGTSDLYTVVESLPEVDDSLVVHLTSDDDPTGMGELVLFVRPVPDVHVDDDLRARIAGALRAELSPRHVPDRIEEVPAVPRTLSGKKLEVPVKRILEGAPAERAASRDSLVDPAALEWYEAHRHR
ncbi:acetoacetate--CoA ligase [Actinomarinicola tropica]|uniref:Acetoacetate--CoA ligase n=1 Tax=Actinomarinicola tropica TaxID=2789776 RepID=A0A5Q2RBS7_9ACTN|nr:acetoacetate--CoA ligase [Actinomarinicola tropica]QGG94288.1 acetoacetate--CoA ligase [Actinomarinicola tropica]